MANTLFLRIEGPLQSWGERAHWSVRDTAPEPTKSGIVGLLACALGVSSDEALRGLAGQVCLGVRCDRPGTLLVDYHTVVGGIMSAEGKIKKNAATGDAETVVSWRHYLCDASFLIAIQGASDLIARLAEAVQIPCWPPYLGRKCCPPSRPLYDGVGEYPTLQAALEAKPYQVWQVAGRLTIRRGESESGGGRPVRAVIECVPGELGSVLRRDEPAARSRRTHGPRYTRDISIIVREQTGEED